MTFEERFWSKVDKSGSCWLWTGARYKDGYGHVRRFKSRKTTAAHIQAFELVHGSIPEGKKVLHTCDVKLCCRPSHLYAGTSKQNSIDMVMRTRQGRQRFTPARARNIQMALVQGVPGRRLARIHEVAQSTISQIRTGRSWAHLGGDNA